ncbi:TenA family protein [Curtobacterium sp. VKM Ac-2865]|uniref:TenA family protein n=1 Tax=Curtobacterium sp. VKM Ac-2865 TaxID=2783817 RepID=UPI00188A48EC|nr:TenA family protein [Curtobacterium sp. VKM Ac-2865]MBF4582812.1 TenA family protein [Curtobacterium sp. VKM Ac-2865]
MTSRSERLVADCATDLTRSADVRFIREAVDGTLDDDAFAAYLAIEERFVRTATRVTGYLVWASADWHESAAHARTVGALVGPQLDWFHRVRPRWQGDPDRIAEAVTRSEPLAAHVLRLVADHGAPAAVTAMFAAETLYAGWCARAAALPVERFSDLRDWIDLHAAASFTEGVRALAAAVDAIPESVDDRTLTAWFRDTLAAEDAFHDAVHPDAVEPGGLRPDALRPAAQTRP